jgi:hypothetical protein
VGSKYIWKQCRGYLSDVINGDHIADVPRHGIFKVLCGCGDDRTQSGERKRGKGEREGREEEGERRECLR